MSRSDINNDFPALFNLYGTDFLNPCFHFGFWSDEQPDLNMEEAQKNMVEHLLSFFPAPPAAVLEVGSSLGSLLAQKGYEVISILPHKEVLEYAKQTDVNRTEFKVPGFFDQDEIVFSKERYDVLFFEESLRYPNLLDDVFKKSRKLLKGKGFVIIGAEVCYDKSITSETAAHLPTDFTIALAENGFYIVENRKLGKNVLSTFDFIIDAFTENLKKIISASSDPDAAEKILFYLNLWKKQKTWYLDGKMGYEIIVARKDDFFVKPYLLGDEHEILPMFNEIFNVNRTMDHWYWKFRDNPYGSHKITEVFSKQGDLVAHYAGYPVPFYSSINKPETFISCQIGDTMTKPSGRNIGLGKTSLLARSSHYFYAKFCEEVPFIYGFNTGTIKKLGMRYLGYTYIDPVTYWVRDILKNSFNPLNLFARLLSGFVVEEVQSVNDEWDDLFNRVCFSYKLLVKRDATYVSWRYVECPDKIHRIFSVRRKGRLIGCSVFTRKDDRLIWGDALFDNGYPESVSYLLQNLLKHYFLGVKTIEGWYSRHPEWWSRQLKELGFKIVSEPNNLTPGFFIFDDPSLLEKLQHYFYYTMGDSDLF